MGNGNNAACRDLVVGNNNTVGTGHTVSNGLTPVAPATSSFTLTTGLSGLTVNTDPALTNGAFADAFGVGMAPGQLTAPSAPQAGMTPVPSSYRVLDGQRAQLTLNRGGSPYVTVHFNAAHGTLVSCSVPGANPPQTSNRCSGITAGGSSAVIV
ncbi:hypothetical protein AB0D37_43200 [Streptomyces sp. NPDC048384]|uniref:hypothetical protein n=1 Tax=Streptomyces sp. NPDC048384 TaxID=3155487 RepID=UPI00342BC1B3